MAQGIYRDYLSSESPKEVSLSLGNRNIRLWQVLRFCNDASALWRFSDIRKFTPKPRFHLIVFQILCVAALANQTCSTKPLDTSLEHHWNIRMNALFKHDNVKQHYCSLCVLWNVLWESMHGSSHNQIFTRIFPSIAPSHNAVEVTWLLTVIPLTTRWASITRRDNWLMRKWTTRVIPSSTTPRSTFITSCIRTATHASSCPTRSKCSSWTDVGEICLGEGWVGKLAHRLTIQLKNKFTSFVTSWEANRPRVELLKSCFKEEVKALSSLNVFIRRNHLTFRLFRFLRI